LQRDKTTSTVQDPATSPVETAQRFASIDILRGLALFGVLTVNLVTEFRVSIFAQFLGQPAEPEWIDRAVLGFVHYGLELKAFALFSFLFGVGLAMQFERLARTGKPLYWLSAGCSCCSLSASFTCWGSGTATS
jgi:uncharacterized membrane protein YeiB